MAIQFPEAPANDDIYNNGGTQYRYNAEKNIWLAISSSAGDFVPVTGGGGTTTYDDMTALVAETGMSDGDQAFVLATNNLYIYKTNGWFKIATVENLQPGSISGVNSSYQLAIDGSNTVITATATDPEGFPLTWSYAVTTGSLANTATVSQVNNVFTITPSTDTADAGEFSITFSVTDGVNGAVNEVSAFTLAFQSALWNDVALSIGTSSTDGLDNKTVINRGTGSYTISAAGSPTQTAFHPYLENWSVEFDGTGDYISTPNDPSFNFGASDFTIEAWIYPTDTSTEHTVASLYGYSNNRRSWSIGVYQGQLDIRFASSGSTATTSRGGTVVANQWYHIAYVRNGNSIKGYLNGTEVTSDTFSSSFYNNTVDPVLVGAIGPSVTGYFDGYISDLRIVKGTAVYTSAFTPPTEKLTAVSGTSLLTCQSNRFIDNSSSSHAITVNGDPKISAYNPLGQDSEYVAGNNKGALASLNENQEAIYISSGIPTSSSFTVECWVYMDSNTSGILDQILQLGGGYLDDLGIGFRHRDDDLQITTGNVVKYTISQNNIFNQWAHIAVTVQPGSTSEFFVNGVSQGSGQVFNMASTSPLSLMSTIIGTTWDNEYPMNGYVTDVVITSGIKYLSNFNPDTEVDNTGALLYLPFDNAGIFDKTGMNTLALAGGTATSTTQTKFADTALYFDGTNDYISFDHKPLGSGDWTIDFWVYFNSIDEGDYIFDFRTGSTNQPAINLYQNDWNYISQGSYLIQTGVAPTTNTWYHVAVVKSSGTTKLYVDGTSLGSYSDSIDYIGNPAAVIGVFRTKAAAWFNGYLENFQILKGVAKYTADFTPPTREQGLIYQEES